MATSDKNLDLFKGVLPDGSQFQIHIVVAEWNEEVTYSLLKGAQDALMQSGIPLNHIKVHWVPGTFELALGAQKCAQLNTCDAVVCLGCVVQGETRHFDFICDSAAHGILEVGLKYNKPVIFGVLTTENQEQALERAGGKHGNKGFEAAVTALKMLSVFGK